jgi:hypothetical protein
LITEGVNGRIFEVTPKHELVWEYVSPYYGKKRNQNMVYRAYRVPYGWIPQVEKIEERAVPRINNSKFRVPGSSRQRAPRVTTVKEGRRVTFNP